MQQLIDNILSEFKCRFDNDPILVKSPGRVNLIGEHTDYNDGFVLPAAIDKKIILALAPNGTNFGRFYALDMGELFETDITVELQKNNIQWANYILGAIDQLKREGHNVKGFDCVFGGDIPIGAGLSSSAAVEGGIIFGLSQLFDLQLSKLDMALLGQKVENEFVGIRCGIMDQFVNIHGEEGSALKLDCRSLEYELFPFSRTDIGIVLCDTGVRRELAGSEYNIRRRQCEEGVRILRAHYPSIKNLRDVDLNMLNKHKEDLDPVVYKRCKYILEENKRVHAACTDLLNDDFESFGQRMYESHYGLRDMYEVSCHELDMLVQIAEDSPGVLGSRMMGGGFGGCTINIVEEEYIADFVTETQKTYKEKQRVDIEIYQTKFGGGTELLSKKPTTSKRDLKK